MTCLSARLLQNFADTCFLLGSYVDWRKIWDEFARQDHRSMSRSFCKVQGHLVKL